MWPTSCKIMGTNWRNHVPDWRRY